LRNIGTDLENIAEIRDFQAEYEGSIPFTRSGGALLLLAHFGTEGVPQPILLDISQETLAEMIETTRSRVSFFMDKFRKLGLISYNEKIEVNNSLLNAVLHEQPEIERDDSISKNQTN
jgi:CRP-like cAMP-binding protein